jgi:hypothetical protein
LLAAFFKITTGILSIEKKLGQKCLDKKKYKFALFLVVGRMVV